jgi:hypothetical protein
VSTRHIGHWSAHPLFPITFEPPPVPTLLAARHHALGHKPPPSGPAGYGMLSLGFGPGGKQHLGLRIPALPLWHMGRSASQRKMWVGSEVVTYRLEEMGYDIPGPLWPHYLHGLWTKYLTDLDTAQGHHFTILLVYSHYALLNIIRLFLKKKKKIQVPLCLVYHYVAVT